MNRDFKQIELGSGMYRYEVRLSSGPCAEDSRAGALEQISLLKLAIESQDGLSCGPHRFQVMKVHHDGERWQLYMEATGN